jgi:hypothetical protein
MPCCRCAGAAFACWRPAVSTHAHFALICDDSFARYAATRSWARAPS